MMIGFEPLPLGAPVGEPVSSFATAVTPDVPVLGAAAATVDGAMRTCKQSNAG
jgi:hypothetical protein